MKVIRNGRPEEPLEVLDTGAIYYVVVLKGERDAVPKADCTVVPEAVYVDVTAALTVVGTGVLLHDRVEVAVIGARDYRFRMEGAALLVEQAA